MPPNRYRKLRVGTRIPSWRLIGPATFWLVPAFRLPLCIASRCALSDKPLQCLLWRQRGVFDFLGILVAKTAQREPAALDNLQRARDSLRMTCEEARQPDEC